MNGYIAERGTSTSKTLRVSTVSGSDGIAKLATASIKTIGI